MSESVPTPAIKSAGSFASISYEQAPRSQSRVPPVAAMPTNEFRSPAALVAPQTPPFAPRKKRKSTSISIRLTEAEETQLHERAAAAHLSVSAYLRACVFEAESLRVQVKEALSQIRAAAQADLSHQPQSPPPSSWRNRLLPHWRRRPQT
ncbi:MAG: hypothetical protein WCA10_18055 [Terracidiphilus sp.]